VLNCDLATWAKKGAAVAALMFGAAVLQPAHAQTPAPCNPTIDLVRLAHPLARVAHKLIAKEPITIVAMGSSSTWGAGASSPAFNYPNKLAEELKAHFPGHSFTVINSGVGGEEVADMLKRFDTAVVAAKPDLVLWQLGTNSVIRDHKFSAHDNSIRVGLDKIRSVGADIVLIDPQFAPKVIAKPEAERMVELIATTAKREDVDLFRRFDVMKRWRTVDNMPFEAFVSPDGLHMNDWSYGCMAKGLGVAIAEAAQRPVVSATAHPHLVP
jgi:lysophospholipase L1-like esterase